MARSDPTEADSTISSNMSRRRKSAQSEGAAEYSSKRDELIRIAARLFRQKGYRATKLGDIAVEAGIDRASLYYYIGSKEELLREAIEEVLSSNLARAEQISTDQTLAVKARLSRIFEMLMTSYVENYPQMYVYIQEQMHQVANDKSPWAKNMLRSTRKFEEIVVNLITAGIKTGELRSDIPVKLASNAVFGMFNWTHRWFTPDGKLSAGDIANAFNMIFFQGMTGSKT